MLGWIEPTASSVKGRNFIILGRLNTDPSHPAARCGDHFQRLTADGWLHAPPVDGARYWKWDQAANRRVG